MNSNILKKVKATAACIVCGAFYLLFIIGKHKKRTKTERQDESAKEVRKKIESSEAHDIVVSSGDGDTAQSAVSRKQEEFRERVRNRLEPQLQRRGSGGDS